MTSSGCRNAELWFDFGDLKIAKAAIDAPFGWPEPFVDAVVAHQRGQGWPSGMDNPRAPFERRATDRFVHDRCGKTPFSVSADKIAALGLTEVPRTAEERRLASLEGWIHLPACDLEALTS